jgi:DHA2 family multidrug resistance protein-like MFS transporter
LPTILISVDMSVLYLALPTLSRVLGADQVEQLWITDIYGFLVAGLLITMGSLGDRIGRRRLLLSGGGLFGVASLLAAFSASPEMLIAARALMGIADATVAPSTWR